MKILHISGARSWGGNEQQLILNINELNQLQTRNFIFGIENTPLQERAKKHNIEFIASKSRKISKFGNVTQLKNIIQQHQFDVIHLHTSDALTLMYFYSLLNPITSKVIFSKKGIGGSSSFLSKLKYNASFLHRIICVSKSVEENFKPMLNEKTKLKLSVVYDCISEKTFPKINDDLANRFKDLKSSYIIGSIANHTKAKDLPTLIEAVSILKNKYQLTHFKLIQVGEFSKLTDDFKADIQQKGVENEIILTSKIEDAMQLNHMFDAFVVSSSREGGPTSALEAMLYQTPVVSTQVGVIPEIIENGKNGFTCPPNQPELLAEAIFKMYSLNEENRKNITDQNYQFIVANFTSNNIAKQILTIYKS